MRMIDAHCDWLTKMSRHPELDFKQDSIYADVSFPRLNKSGVKVQCFAIFISNRERVDFYSLLADIDLFYRKVASHPDVVAVRTRHDLERAEAEGKLAAILTLEGAEGLEGSLMLARTAHQLGVRLLGLTWNFGNWAADGVLEPRQGGLSQKGKELVAECDRLGIILDVSHLNDRGFWELTELTQRPFVATHSNSRRICPDPRNLTDEQLAVLIARDSMVGLTFVPWFVKSSEPSVKDILTHIDHVSSLGGSRNIGFGSDFDGVEYHIPGLEHAGCFDKLANELYKRYAPAEADAYLYSNWRRFLGQALLE